MKRRERMLSPGRWLEHRGERRAAAVDRAYGVLGLDYGKGHLDNLYLAAYRDGYADACAAAVQDAAARRELYPLDVEFFAQHREIRAGESR